MFVYIRNNFGTIAISSFTFILHVRVLQTQYFAYKPPSNKSRTSIEATPKSWKKKLHISRGFSKRLYGVPTERPDCFSVWYCCCIMRAHLSPWLQHKVQACTVHMRSHELESDAWFCSNPPPPSISLFFFLVGTPWEGGVYVGRKDEGRVFFSDVRRRGGLLLGEPGQGERKVRWRLMKESWTCPSPEVL